MTLHRDIHDYAHIVFDWNGTIVDDVGLALDCVNRVRTELELTPVDLSTYREIFRFPISTFYQELGFDFRSTSFEELISLYLGYFDPSVADCGICSGFHDLAVYLKAHHVPISILSASQQKTLERTAHGKTIAPLVENLFGLRDQTAANKQARAFELNRLIVSSRSGPVLMIGDTDHDYDVARQCGWDFVAVASGHQNLRRLERLNTPVFNTLDELLLVIRPNTEAAIS